MTANKVIQVSLWIILIGLITSIALLCTVPPVDRDALTHHLFVPKLYLLHGSIYEIPEIPFSYYPMNLELLYTIPLYLGNDIIPKYIHFLFAILTTGLVYSYLKSRISATYALLGSLFFLSLPIIIKLSTTVYVDLGLMFFTTSSLLLILHWLHNTDSIRPLLLAGICCGLAAGTKYNGLVVVVVLILLLPLFFIRSKQRLPGSDKKSIKYCLIFAVTTLLTFSPWLVRNYSWTGNPIYPLYDSLFQSLQAPGTTNPELNIDTTETSPTVANNIILSRKIIYNETWTQALLLPIRLFFEGQDDSHQFFDGKLNPFLLFLPMFAFFRSSSPPGIHREKQFLLAFSFLFFFFTFFQQVTRVRYIICILPPLVILSTFGLHAIFSTIFATRSEHFKKALQICVFTLPLAFICYNFQYLAQQYRVIRPMSYLSGKVSRDQYITHFRPEYPAIQFVNAHEQATKILVIFLGNRGYYFDKPVQFDLSEGKSLLCETISQAKTDNEALENLKASDISHLLIRHDLFKQWIEQQYDEEDVNKLNHFFHNKTKLIYEANGHGVYQLLGSNG